MMRAAMGRSLCYTWGNAWMFYVFNACSDCRSQQYWLPAMGNDVYFIDFRACVLVFVVNMSSLLMNSEVRVLRQCLLI